MRWVSLLLAVVASSALGGCAARVAVPLPSSGQDHATCELRSKDWVEIELSPGKRVEGRVTSVTPLGVWLDESRHAGFYAYADVVEVHRIESNRLHDAVAVLASAAMLTIIAIMIDHEVVRPPW